MELRQRKGKGVRKGSRILPAAAALAGFLVCSLSIGAGEENQPRAISEARRAELIHLVRHDCGACHGMTLNGGLGPALTPAALAEKPPESLVATLLYGRTGTPMPPFLPFLTEDEARWIVERLVAGFPTE
ncbi:cytochrome c55X [Hydrogenophilus islandicus]